MILPLVLHQMLLDLKKNFKNHIPKKNPNNYSFILCLKI